MYTLVPVHLEVLVEEYSAEVTLEALLPKLLPERATFKIHAFRGKHDLLKKLPDRLKAYRSWIPENWRIVVLCDRDRDDCYKLKKELEDRAKKSDFTTKSSPDGDRFTVLNRIAIEELEAWFLGDPEAIAQAYPKIRKTYIAQELYRNPDGIRGGTWEALEKLLQGKGYHSGGLNKIQAAREIAPYLQQETNRSQSFQVFCSGLQSLSR